MGLFYNIMWENRNKINFLFFRKKNTYLELCQTKLYTRQKEKKIRKENVAYLGREIHREKVMMGFIIFGGHLIWKTRWEFKYRAYFLSGRLPLQNRTTLRFITYR
jgi:hypothetical protein